MTTNFLVGLFLGLAGSLHCIGMCGPLVLLFPLNGTSKMFGLLNSLIYQLGRVFIYVLLGLLFGAVFQIIDLKYFERYFSIGIGIGIDSSGNGSGSSGGTGIGAGRYSVRRGGGGRDD